MRSYLDIGTYFIQKAKRELMMESVLEALRAMSDIPGFQTDLEAVNCHHNNVDREHHFGKEARVTRKGAVRARAGDHGATPYLWIRQRRATTEQRERREDHASLPISYQVFRFSRRASARSDSTISLAISSTVILGTQPSLSLAFSGLPRRVSTSVGRK